MSSFETFWNGKRVLVTGHTGFKGAWLSLWLHKMGASVVGYSFDVPTDPSLFVVAKIPDIIDSQEGDIRDTAKLTKLLDTQKPDVVLHLAAQSLVRKSYADPMETFDINVMGTASVLDAVRQCDSVKACLVVTSDKCYENREWDWGYRETEAMGGYDAYSASKGCAELLVAAYRQSFFNAGSGRSDCAVATARAGNVIGGGDWAEDRLVPAILGSLAKNEPVSIRSPNSVRPWQHVLEPLSGYLVLAEALFTDRESHAQGWNFGPSDLGAKPVSWIVDNFVQTWGSGSWVHETFDNLHEAKQLKLDSSKARELLGWAPVWQPAEAIEMTVNWHKHWLDGANMQNYTIDQINAYSALTKQG